jgi:hypothetical protein
MRNRTTAKKSLKNCGVTVAAKWLELGLQHKRGCGRAKCSSNLYNRDYQKIFLAAFDSGDVGAVQTSESCEVCLGVPFRYPKLPYRLA